MRNTNSEGNVGNLSSSRREKVIYGVSTIAGPLLALLGNHLVGTPLGTVADAGALFAATIHTIGAVSNEFKFLYPEEGSKRWAGHLGRALIHAGVATGIFGLTLS